MEWITRLCWLALAVIHVMPSLPAIRPAMIKSLYGIEPTGALGLLLSHRAALFAIVLIVCIWAIFAPEVRRVASVVAGVSMISFLVFYARSGYPVGGLRTVALVDLVGLIPLLWVIANAWSGLAQRTI